MMIDLDFDVSNVRSIVDLVLMIVMVEKNDQNTAVLLQVAVVAAVDDELYQMDAVVRVADRINIYKVIDFS